MDFDGKTAVITGAGSGIGQETARQFATRGASVVAVDIDDEALEGTVSDIDANDSAGDAIGITADVSEEDDVRNFVDRAVEEFGSIDVLYNNAGVSQSAFGPQPVEVENVSREMWEQVLRVNLDGAFYGAKHAVPHMREQGEGVILNTSSGVTLDMYHGLTPYATSKGGVNTLTKQLAKDLAGENIRVNAICPGPVDTSMFFSGEKDEEWVQETIEQIPLGRIIEPRDIAGAAVFLASDMAEMVTGLLLPVDGGQSV